MKIETAQTTERDAARYHWLKETFFGQTLPNLYDSPGEQGGCVSSEQFDADIDAEIAKERADGK